VLVRNLHREKYRSSGFALGRYGRCSCCI